MILYTIEILNEEVTYPNIERKKETNIMKINIQCTLDKATLSGIV
jgi:hypothetical protein